MKLFGFPFRKSRNTAAACSYCALAKRARPRLKVSCSACEGASSCCRAALSEAARTAKLAKGDRTSAAASAAAPIGFHLLNVMFLRRAGASLIESNDPARTRETHDASRYGGETFSSAAQDDTAPRPHRTRRLKVLKQEGEKVGRPPYRGAALTSS